VTFDGGLAVSEASSTGAAGRIRLDVDRLEILNGGQLSAVTQDESSAGSAGRGGNIEVNARDAIVVKGFDADGFVSSIRTQTRADARGGDIDLRARTIEITQSGLVAASTLGSGPAGNIALTATEHIVLAARGRVSADTIGGTGAAGAIRVASPALVLSDGGAISSESTLGSTGSAGNIAVAAGSIAIGGDGETASVSSRTTGSGSGSSIDISATTIDLLPGGRLVTSSATGSGSAGNILVSAGSLRIDGGQIDSSTGGAGAGGNVLVSAPDVRLSNGGTIEVGTSGAGAGGNIAVSTSTLDIGAGGRITASSTGTGTAGAIDIVATDALRLFGGVIATEAISSDGGNITIRVGNLVHLKNGEITTSVGSGQGSGGNILIDPTFVILESSRIVANAFGGAGGSINIIANVFLTSPDSVIDASSQLGLPGSVQISAPQTDVLSGLPALPAQFFDASGLLRAACTAPGATGRSRLVGVGRGGVELPLGYAPSRYFADETLARAEHAAATAANPPVAPSARVLLAGICKS
jgi:large exoprotein involved in heme utilization and adhesion